MRGFYSPILAAIWCFGAAIPAAAAPVIPDCAGRVEITGAKIVRVERNGALILSDGRAVLLEGVRLPLERDGDRPALADNALSQVRALAMAGPLTLTATAPKEDRYDRVRVQAFRGNGVSGTSWLQMELLKRGLARVEIAPDRNECAPDFYEAEAAARAAHAGLWAFPAYAVRSPDGVKQDIGTFQIVDGRITASARRDGQWVLTFDRGDGLVVTVAADDARKFRDLDPPMEGLAGQHVRVRGMVQSMEGRPAIALSNPSQIELLDK
jgi:endonuclease YncB( thermonuclease family)